MKRLVTLGTALFLAACGGGSSNDSPPSDPPPTDPPSTVHAPAIDPTPVAPVQATWTVQASSIVCPGADYSGRDEAQWLCRWKCGILPPATQPHLVLVYFCEYETGWDVCLRGEYETKYCLAPAP